MHYHLISNEKETRKKSVWIKALIKAIVAFFIEDMIKYFFQSIPIKENFTLYSSSLILSAKYSTYLLQKYIHKTIWGFKKHFKVGYVSTILNQVICETYSISYQAIYFCKQKYKTHTFFVCIWYNHFVPLHENRILFIGFISA